jgi:hypothetical protein
VRWSTILQRHVQVLALSGIDMVTRVLKATSGSLLRLLSAPLPTTLLPLALAAAVVDVPGAGQELVISTSKDMPPAAAAFALARAAPYALTLGPLHSVRMEDARTGAAAMRALAPCLDPTSLHELHFRGAALGAVGAAALVPTLPSLTALRHLDLSSNGLGAGNGALLLAAAMPTLLALTAMLLPSNPLSDGALAVLMPPIAALPALAILDLAGSVPSAIGAETVAAHLLAAPQLAVLRCTAFGANPSALGAAAVCPVDRPMRALTVSSDALGGEAFWELFTTMCEPPGLALLELVGTDSQQRVTRDHAVLPRLDTLTHLSIFGAYDPFGVPGCLLTGLSTMTALSDLTLGLYDEAAHDALGPTISSLSSLTRLALVPQDWDRGCGAVCPGTAAASAAAAAALPHLRALHLAIDLDDREHAEALATIQTCTALTALAAYATDFPDAEHEPEERELVMRSLAALPPLLSLQLSILNTSFDAAALLATQATLTELVLHSPLSHAQAVRLAHELARLSRLETLNLHSCQLDHMSTHALTLALPRLHRLRHLDLSGNAMSDDSVCSLLCALVAPPTAPLLRTLILSGHHMTASCLHSTGIELLSALSALTCISLCSRGKCGLHDCPTPRLHTLFVSLPCLVVVRVAKARVKSGGTGISCVMAEEFGLVLQLY